MCYSPASYATSDSLVLKAKLFRDRKGTVSADLSGVLKAEANDVTDSQISQTHWPHANIFPNERELIRLGKPETYTRTRPIHEPLETEQVLKLAGVVPY